MPQKTVYIREQDRELWDQAGQLSDGSLAGVLADALRALLDRHAAVNQEIEDDGQSIAAPFGEKMIQLQIRFFTDEIAADGKILPKHAWDAGMVTVQTNESHGLAKGQPVPFNSILELPTAIEKQIIKQGIVLHSGSRSSKYLRSRPAKDEPRHRKASK
jgi:hypothetical protein